MAMPHVYQASAKDGDCKIWIEGSWFRHDQPLGQKLVRDLVSLRLGLEKTARRPARCLSTVRHALMNEMKHTLIIVVHIMS